MSDRITAGEIRSQNGFCISGQKEWFRGRGIDFRRHIKEGTPVELLRETGDAMALRVVANWEASRGR